MQWVGGVVGERNFNFFIQFCSYAGIYALFVMIVMAIFVAEARGRVCASFISLQFSVLQMLTR